MPSPVGHSLMGLIIYYSASGKATRPFNWRSMTLCVLAANAADLDFIPGLLIGELGRFHHGPSHSIGFAFLFGFSISILSWNRGRTFLMAFSLYLSHVLLDYLIQDPSPPYGVPLLWPLSKHYFMAPFAFFSGVEYPSSFTESFWTLLTAHNLFTIFAEVLFLSPVCVLAYCWKRSKRDQPAEAPAFRNY